MANKVIDKKAIEKSIREIILALGDDPNREGLIDTPTRVANMYAEIFEGMCYTNEEIAAMFNKTFEQDIETKERDMVIVRDIEIFSCCEHHMALMYDMRVSVAYIPNGKIVGLSKIARIAEMVGKRLQLQEKIGTDIAEIITMVTGSSDIAIRIEGKHSCMTARGIKNGSSSTVTLTMRGAFKEDAGMRMEFLSQIK